jgi:hypothetical protein
LGFALKAQFFAIILRLPSPLRHSPAFLAGWQATRKTLQTIAQQGTARYSRATGKHAGQPQHLVTLSWSVLQ